MGSLRPHERQTLALPRHPASRKRRLTLPLVTASGVLGRVRLVTFPGWCCAFCPPRQTPVPSTTGGPFGMLRGAIVAESLRRIRRRCVPHASSDAEGEGS